MGVIAEFVGLPGAGKSTIAHGVARELRCRGVPVSEPTYDVDHRVPRGVRARRKLRQALRGAGRDAACGSRELRALIASGQPTARDLLSVAVNWFYVTEVVRRCAAGAGVHLLDQGVLQALWSIAYRARHRDRLLRDGSHVLGAAIPERLTVVVVEGHRATIARRLDVRAGCASRMERLGVPAACDGELERSAALLDLVVAVAEELAREGRASVVRVDGGCAESLAGTIAALADTLADARAAPPAGPR